MYIRQVKKQRSKESKVFYQYNLVQNSRIDGKVKQHVILYLGSDKELADLDKRKLVLAILKSRIFGQPELLPPKVPKQLAMLASRYYEKYLLKYGEEAQNRVSIPPARDTATYETVDTESIELDDVKTFGAEHLCKAVLDRLKLKEFLKERGMNHQQATKSMIAIAARAIFSVSEHRTAQFLDLNSSLKECYDYNQPLTYKQLYTTGDKLYQMKQEIDQFLFNRVTDLFDLEDKLVIFDISNSYFETTKRGSRLAEHGHSKEKRFDRPVVVFTGVINREGFIRHSRIYEGKKPDAHTLEDMIADLSEYSPAQSKKTVVMDAGIATEDNLLFLRKKGYDYVCVARKRIKDYRIESEKIITETLVNGTHTVRLSIIQPQDQPDTWMYVQSDMKRKKESSMDEKLSKRWEAEMQNAKDALSKKGGTKQLKKVWERIGRIKQKHNRISSRYEVHVEEKDGIATDIRWIKKDDPVKTDKHNGVYFIRTSYTNPGEKELWDIYNTIREVESTFRCLKSSLQIRPIYHQTDQRVEAHIYLTMLAYQLVNTVRYMLRQEHIHYDWDNIKRIMSTQTLQTIEMNTQTKRICIRKPSKPNTYVQDIYNATGCTLSTKARKKYVVYH